MTDAAADKQESGLQDLRDILEQAVPYTDMDIVERVWPSIDDIPKIDVKLCRRSQTDLGNAERLVERYGRDLLWVPEIGWIVWTGTHWDRKNGDVAARLVGQKAAKKINGEVLAMGALGHYPAEKIADFKERVEKFAKFAKDSRNQRRLTAMLGCAEPILHASNDDMDQHKRLFNIKSGTMNLKAAESDDGFDGGCAVKGHARGDKITRMSNAEYERHADCPRFMKFLHDIQPDADIRQFLQRYFGYCLTGAITEQIVVMFYGKGSNGKSTLMDLINYVMGDYALVLPFATLLQDDRRRGSEASPDLARLPGSRFVTAAEPETGARFSESVLKTLTGGEKLTVRHLHKDFFEFYPQFKLCLSFNNRPVIRGQDDGIWRRIVLVPFDQKFVKESDLAKNPGAKVKDTTLEHALRQEIPGIFNWMLDGYRMWAEGGLKIPDRIRAATEAYKTESSPVQQFLAACTEPAAGVRVSASTMYDAYKLWCQENALDPISQTAFGYRMNDAGVEKERYGTVFYVGLDLTSDMQTAVQAMADRRYNKGSSGDSG